MKFNIVFDFYNHHERVWHKVLRFMQRWRFGVSDPPTHVNLTFKPVCECIGLSCTCKTVPTVCIYTTPNGYKFATKEAYTRTFGEPTKSFDTKRFVVDASPIDVLYHLNTAFPISVPKAWLWWLTFPFHRTGPNSCVSAAVSMCDFPSCIIWPQQLLTFMQEREAFE